MKFKRIISFFLAIVMMTSCMSLTVGATDVAEEATIQVESKYGVTGSTVTLDVTVKNNPGILGMTLMVEYDEASLKLIQVENGDCLPDLEFTTPQDLSSGCPLPWDGEFVYKEHIRDGVIAKLTFEIMENAVAEKNVAVQLSYDPGAIIDNDLNPLTPHIENGSIYVIDYLPGDVNMDGNINTTDVVVLRRFLADYDVILNRNASDVNGDGNINTTDIVYIRRFVAGGYGITLKPAKHIHKEVIDEAKAPTCTETGLTEGKHCSECKQVLVKQEIVPAKGHNSVNGICSVCGEGTLDYNGEKVSILYWNDAERLEFEVDSLSGNLIGDALYHRNAAVEEKLNVQLNWIGTPGNSSNQAGFISDVATAWMSGESYDIYAGYSMTAATIAMQGFSRDLTEVSAIDFSQPWWPQSMLAENSIDGRLYYCTGDLSANMLNMMYCTYFNKDLAAKLNLGDLYSMVDNGTWTIDKMSELAAKAYADLNGNGVRDINDSYGIGIGSNVHFDAFFTGSDLHTIAKDTEDIPCVSESFVSSKTASLLEKLNSIFHQNIYAAFATTVQGWSNEPFAQGRVLFILDRAYVKTYNVFSDSTVNTGILPVPKYDVEQQSYMTALAFPFSTYEISSGISEHDAERAGAVLECMGSESYNKVSPVWFEYTMGRSYQDGDADARMFDLIRDTVQVEFGRIFTTPLSNITYSAFRSAANSGQTNWGSFVKPQIKVLDKALQKVVATVLGKYSPSCTHAVDSWVESVPATCTATGIRTGTCTTCGKTVIETIEKIAHTYVDGKCSGCNKIEIPEGTVVYAENFDYPDDDNTESVLETIGWTKLTKELNGVYNETDAEFAIIDGRLYYDNWDPEGLPEGDTRIRGKDGYYQIDMLNQEYMAAFMGAKYTLQYDLEATDVKEKARYATIITHCSADGQCYNQFAFRIGGYGNNQCHFYGSWKTYDAFDPATDLYAASTAQNEEECATKGTTIAYKLLGKHYDATPAFINIPVTIRLQWDPEMGYHVYMKTSTMDFFVKVSEPSINADGPMYVGAWEGAAVQFKLGATIDGYIDNIAMWTGWGEMSFDGHYISDNWTVETESTCSTHGRAYATCTKCGEKVYRELSLGKHAYTNWTVVADPTCTTVGSEIGTCECGATETKQIAKLEHIFEGEICKDCGRGYNYDLAFAKSVLNGVSYYRVTGIGSCTDTEIYIPASVDGIPVTQIDHDAFHNNTQISKVVIPNGVTSVGSQAFYGCTSLISLILPETLTETNYGLDNLPAAVYTVEENGGRYIGTATNPYFLLADVLSKSQVTEFVANEATKLVGYGAFEGCNYLQSIAIPEGIEYIASYAFDYCDTLKSVSIPSTATYLGSSLFAGCPAIETVTIHTDNPVYKSVNNCIINKKTNVLEIGCVSSVIPADGSVTIIGNNAFYNIPFSTFVIPEGIVEIEGRAFDRCSDLIEIVIPNTLTMIGDRAFRNCSSLQSFIVAEGNSTFYAVGNCLIRIADDALIASPCGVIPDCVKAIGPYAFYNDNNLKSIVIPDGVTSIGEYAFGSCYNLASVTLPESLTSIGSNAFRNCEDLTEIVIPNGVTSIGEYAFDFCYNLASVTLPESLTSISSYAFRNCSDLTEIVIPNGVTAINNGTFRYCSSLTKITIPSSVTKIGNYAFEGCNALTTVNYDGTIAQWNQINIGINNEPLTKIEPNVHTCDNWVVTVAPTCTQTGLETGTCECGVTLTREIEKLAHTFEGENCTMCGRGYNYDLKFTKYTSDGTSYYRVTGIGKCQDTEICIPAMYKGLPVLEIGASAFYGNTNITRVEMAEGITKIYGNAFGNCPALTTIVLPQTLIDGNAYFKNINDNIYTVDEYGTQYLGTADNPYFLLVQVKQTATNVIINPETRFIAQEAFCWCEQLTSVVIPEGVEGIGTFAFWGAANLSSVSFPKTLTQMGNSIFGGCSALNEIVMHPDNPVFECGNNCIWVERNGVLINGCSASIIPDDSGIVSIADGAFRFCSFESYVIPEGITNIGSHSFADCANLTTLYFPTTLSEIGSYAFLDSEKVDTIYVAAGNEFLRFENQCIIRVEDNALIYACPGITEIPNGVNKIGKYAFADRDISQITIPNTITEIAAWAFYNCDSLIEVVIPDSVTIIGESAFRDCNNLTRVVLPANMSRIEHYAFANSNGLTEIVIPASVNYIGNFAFRSCSALTTVYYGGTAEQWATISIGKDNNALGNAKVIFNDVPAESLEYVELEDGTLAVVGIGTVTEQKIVIPSEVNGKAVTQIAASAFRSAKNAVSVTIPDTVVFIGDNAFFGNKLLKYIYIPDSVVYIGETALGRTPNLVTIEVEEGNPVYKSVDGCLIDIANKTLIGCTINTVLPSDGSVEIIGEQVFSGMNNLGALVIPEGIKGIGGYAFTFCNGLDEVHLPASVTRVDATAFRACYTLSKFVVAPENSVYRVSGNALIDIKERMLVRGGKDTVIPADGSVTCIGKEAFNYVRGLVEIVIPNGVTAIYRNAFEGCEDLKAITLPASITTLASNSLGSTKTGAYPEVIYYLGTEEEWNAISIESGNDYLANVKIVYNYVTESLKYSERADGTLTVSGIGTVTSKDIVIPAEYNGKAVTAIAAKAFTGKNIRSVEIPNSVVSIGANAFVKCYNLEYVYIPASVTNIANMAFGRCPNIQEIVVDENNPVYASVDGCLVDILNQKLIGKTVSAVIPTDGSVKVIGESVFADVDNLDVFVIPEQITTICDGAFMFCDGLNEVVIHAGVSYIDENAFRGCYTLTKFTVDAGNTAYHTAGNALIETESKKLIRGGSNTVIPTDGSVTSLGDDSFSYVNDLYEIAIPEGIVSIGKFAFEGCGNLAVVILPSTLEAVGSSALNYKYNTALNTIYYCGTEEQWTALAVDLSKLTNVTVYYYSENHPTVEGNYWHYADGVPSVWELN